MPCARPSFLLAALALAASPTAARAALVPQPASIVFPDTGTGSPSAPQMLSFTNNGAQVNVQAITVGGANPMDFAVSNLPALPSSYGNGAGFTISVTFMPTLGGARSGQVVVMLAGGATATAALSGNGVGPMTVVMPNSVSLGGLPFGQAPPPVTVTVTNAGGSKVSVKSLPITGPDAAAFAIQGAPALPISLGANVSMTFKVAFTPQVKNKTAMAVVTVTCDDPKTPMIAVPIVGTAGDPVISLDTGTLIFGNQRVGIPSAPFPVVITNTGYSTLHVSAIALGGANAGDFSVMKPMLPAPVAVGATAMFQVTFAPLAVGARSGQITVNSDDPAALAKLLPMTGAGTTAMASIAPNKIDFGMVSINKPATQNLTIQNAGNGILTITQAVISGAQAGWFSTAALPMGGLQAPGAVNGMNGMATVPVTVKALDNGAGSAVLTLMTDDAKMPMFAVPLTALGASPVISLTPAMIDFGSLAVGSTAMAQTVTVANKGTQPLTILQVAATGKNPGDFPIQNEPAAGTMIPAGKSIDFTIAFMPSLNAGESARLTLLSDDPNAPQSRIDLYGVGTMAMIEVAPPMLDFGTQLVSATIPKQSVTITNAGDAPLVITSVQIVASGMGMTAPYSTDLKGLPTVDAGATLKFGITFAPTSAGLYNAQLIIQPMDPTLMPATVELTGTAIAPSVAVNMTPLIFPPVMVGDTSAPLSITLRNLGIKSVTVDRLDTSDPQFGPALKLNKSIPPSMSLDVPVSFTPAAVGAFAADLTLYLAGSKTPLVTIKASGAGVAPPKTGGCGLAGRPDGAGASIALAGLLALGLLRRRARRRR